MKRTIIEIVQQILLILNPSELIFSTLLVAVFLVIQYKGCISYPCHVNL